MKINFKKETFVTITLIIIYVLLNTICINNFGQFDIRTFICNLILVIFLLLIIYKNKLFNYLGLNSFPKAKKYLYFIPLLLIISVNLWNITSINYSVKEIIPFIGTMLLIGFLEEIIFRGFLFKEVAKENVEKAIVIASLTFGVGHAVNLLNGASLYPTMMQMIYSIAIGYLFANIFYETKSIWPCIIAHALMNALSVFNTIESKTHLLIVTIFLTAISLIYAEYIKNKNN